MFTSSKRGESYESASGAPGGGATIIARGVRVEGDFSSQGDVVIEGEVNGHVSTSGLLTVGSDAKLKAEVAASEAVVSGTIQGTVTVKKRLELKSTAKVTGDVTCEIVVVEAGAVLNGKISVGAVKAEVPKPATAAKTATATAATAA